MSKNRRLVEFFVNEFYQYQLTDLSYVVAKNFTFIAHSKPPILYEDFEKQTAFFFFNASVKHGPFTSNDDKYFYSNIEVTSLDFDLLRAEVVYEIEDDLLQKIEIKYDLSDEDFEKFYNSLFEISLQRS